MIAYDKAFFSVQLVKTIFLAFPSNMICQTATWAVNASTVAGVSSGGSGATAFRLNGPMDVFSDNFGSVYVSDLNNNRVQKWLPGASSGTTVAGGSPGTGLDQLSIGKSCRIGFL